MEREKSIIKLLDEIDAGKRKSPLKAIRAFCLMCVGYKSDEVKECTANNQKDTRCPLFKYRFGKNESGTRIKGKPFPRTELGIAKSGSNQRVYSKKVE